MSAMSAWGKFKNTGNPIDYLNYRFETEQNKAPSICDVGNPINVPEKKVQGVGDEDKRGWHSNKGNGFK